MRPLAIAALSFGWLTMAPRFASAAGEVRGTISVAPDFLESDGATPGPAVSFWEEENGVIPTLPERVDLAREVAVVLTPATPAPSAGVPAQVDVRLEGGGATPAVLVIRPRTTVRFVNTDINPHELRTPNLASFTPPAIPRSHRWSYTFAEPGTFEIRCSRTPSLQLYVIVVNTPYATNPEADGSFRIRDLPDGDYAVRVYYKGTVVVGRTLTLRGGRRATFDARIERPAAAPGGGS